MRQGQRELQRESSPPVGSDLQKFLGDAAVGLDPEEEYVLIEIELGVVQGRASGPATPRKK